MSEAIDTSRPLEKPAQHPVSEGVAWVFAGQGSQIAGMGLDIYEQFPEAQAFFESTTAGFNLKELCFEAPAEVLANTRYTQACMAAFAAAVIALLKRNGLSPTVTLGLSLGEYCALYAAGVFDYEALLNLLSFRGAIMADASDIPSRMTAVFGLDDKVVEQATLEVAATTGAVVSCTNFNCPKQVVIGGEEAAVIATEALLTQRGARRCITLNTSGPFHTSLMKEPARLLEERLSVTKVKSQEVPVIFNASALPASDGEIRSLLVKQIASPVLFTQSVKKLEALGVSRVIEVGPGRVLAGLIKKTSPALRVSSIETADDIREVVKNELAQHAS